MGNIIAWIVLGLIAGAIAKAIYPGHQGGGILATMVLGIVGAFVGGMIFTFLNTGKLALVASAGLNIGSIIVAIIGAMVAIFIWGLVTRSAA
ncbi:GlsB/YeaQ/YmgE family stress response membrane protein [Rivularia sp. UHCC 0363]|uniref:GlsB/YeaQ/YmgE family stress response membrane protein n=1 Tax=Rivularia sp. UHCC 0363 TaxID=3110244 RepID=UPI002B2105C9|nr:GlsB/YeaQ/YmgE family stress response membrane protein [Rivularia sp. UHCC 0363]MEA5598673.1 GlsB/YeaQ/YmgE family stress response membrane protein [Rivularia sp. UHCC 0363]